MRAVPSLLPVLFVLTLLLPALHLSCGSSPTPTALPTATFTPPPTATPVPTATPSHTPTPQPTPTPPLHEADRDALVALYHATGGPGWTNSHKWLTGAPLREWRGVATDAAGRVVRLELHDNGLTGEIPPELGDLENLERLNLSSNELTGEIPPELGDLEKLERLNLSGNELAGEIPPGLGNLASLTGLALVRNDLSGGIPPELGNLASLVSLHLHSNRLSGGIPAELSNLVSLTWLRLHSNEISGKIPPELGNLAELTYLELHENDLSGRIPPELGNLSYLETLMLSENRLSGEIPPELGELTELKTLALTGNRLSGCVPVGLRNVAWKNDADALGLPLCQEEMRLFQDPWGRFQVQIPTEWEEEELETQEYLFHFQASTPDGTWAVYIVVVDSGSLSLAEYADHWESAFLDENPEHLVRSPYQTAQDLRAVMLEMSFEDGEAVMLAYILDDDVGIAVGYGFPSGWSDAGRDLAHRSFDTFIVN